jgi:SulP family sulfate permease
MAQAIEVEAGVAATGDDVADPVRDDHLSYDAGLAADPDIAVYRISGAFFFGAAGSVAAALDSIQGRPKAYIIDFTAVPLLDSTAAATIGDFARRARRRNAQVMLTGARPAIRRMLMTHGMRPPDVHFRSSIEAAVTSIHATAEPAVAA